MKTLHAALLDDNEAWLSKEADILHAYARQAGLLLELSAHTSSLALLAAGIPAPDVLFSDIEMGEDDSGISFAQHVHSIWPACQVVYVTNHLRYALDVYTTEHLWFVLKDQFEQRLPEVLSKLLRQMDERDAVIVLKTTSHELVSVPCSDVVYLERNGRITKVYVAGGAIYQVPDRIATLLDKLPSESFARSHGSFAVNLSHVRGIDADTVRTTDDWEVPVSRRFTRGFKDAFLGWADRQVV